MMSAIYREKHSFWLNLNLAHLYTDNYIIHSLILSNLICPNLRMRKQEGIYITQYFILRIQDIHTIRFSKKNPGPIKVGPKHLLGPNVPWAQILGPKHPLGPNVSWAQTSLGPKCPATYYTILQIQQIRDLMTYQISLQSTLKNNNKNKKSYVTNIEVQHVITKSLLGD